MHPASQRPAAAPQSSPCLTLTLDTPWPHCDALALCESLTGVRGHLQHGPPDPAAKPCLLALVRVPPHPVLPWAQPVHARCPRGVDCVRIPLPSTAARENCFLWLTPCRTPCPSAPDTLAAPPDSYPGPQFELAVSLLTLAASHARKTLTAPPPRLRASRPLTEHQKHLVRLACAAVHARCADPHLSLKQLATEYGHTLSYLCTLFSRAVGVPFRSYLHVWRLQRVREWLAEDRLNVKEIAAATGFADPNRLRLAFKCVTGLSPRDWREQWLSGSLRASEEPQNTPPWPSKTGLE